MSAGGWIHSKRLVAPPGGGEGCSSIRVRALSDFRRRYSVGQPEKEDITDSPALTPKSFRKKARNLFGHSMVWPQPITGPNEPMPQHPDFMREDIR
ncbi:hypothetical protein EJ06DRAFT_528314 [Trichodelitschia bisporula]|uniref:Uncharacterized protein n=1 Tax=Trichodelitschia bisporula TaxID=703511 RepID=A0A6G1I293_9PEZI|nr:hypothetical protein EJ06DRAFT_528314 [Trichodelitschia bisporula]